MEAYFIGIDVGTQGVRVVLLDNAGDIEVSVEEVFPLTDILREEQSTALWWGSCIRLLNLAVKKAGKDVADKILSIGVTSTSGTVIPLESDNRPLHNAIMYSDKRSEQVSGRCSEMAQEFHNHGFTAFNSATGLAKMVWLKETFPAQFLKVARWVHASDFITSKLSGIWGVTDYTNAFKSVFDVTNFSWPDYISQELLPKNSSLPIVHPTVDVLGTIDKYLAQQLGLPENTKVTTGLTDGCASQIASGAVDLGDWNATIGTTMVIKGVTKDEILDPLGRLYSHRHPQGYWMPGGASNTGADWVSQEFSDGLDELNRSAAQLIPTGVLNYPLRQLGERFPLNAPSARGFEQLGLNQSQRFTANMEGVAYIERLSYELIENLSGETVYRIYTAGGASNSEVWLKIRANVLNRPIIKMKHVSGAVGAAISASSKTYYTTLTEATRALTHIDREILPDEKLSSEYQNQFHRFIEQLREKGLLDI